MCPRILQKFILFFPHHLTLLIRRIIISGQMQDTVRNITQDLLANTLPASFGITPRLGLANIDLSVDQALPAAQIKSDDVSDKIMAKVNTVHTADITPGHEDDRYRRLRDLEENQEGFSCFSDRLRRQERLRPETVYGDFHWAF